MSNGARPDVVRQEIRAGPTIPRAAMSPEAFRHETGVSRETLARLEDYAALLAKWNRAINLVSKGSLADLWRRHMLDSAQLADHLPEAPAGRARIIADLGSGAGFPGLVLALLGAGRLHLIESDQRKASFLREAARSLGLDLEIHNARIETLPALPVDVVTARACAPLPKLIDYAKHFPAAGPDGKICCLFPKGGEVERELTEADKTCHMTVERLPSRSDASGTILRIWMAGRDT